MLEFIMAINWSVNPEIIGIGPLSLRWYGLLFALGFVVGYFIMQKIFLLENKSNKDLESLTITMIVGTILGARLGHCFFYEPQYYLANPLKMLMVWEGGLASHGAAIGIIFALWIFSKRRNNISFVWISDRIVIVVALAAMFIRLGNFFNSEIIGSQTDVPWAVVFTRFDDLPRHPTQLYEAIFYLFSFITLYITYAKSYKTIGKGYLCGLFLLLIFGSRFIIEFFKEPQSQFEVGMLLNMGQLLSIPFIIIGIISIFISRKFKY